MTALTVRHLLRWLSSVVVICGRLSSPVVLAVSSVAFLRVVVSVHFDAL